MYKVNLIRDGKTARLVKKYRNQILLIMGFVSLGLVVVYIALLIHFFVLQKQLTNITNEQFLTINGQSYTAEELTKALYSQKKLEQIKTIYLSYPEYYLYHQFLLDHIFKYKSFTIDDYALDKEHSVKVSLATDNLDDIFSLITTLESKKVAMYFDYFEIQNIELFKNTDNPASLYRIEFELEFNNKLLHEKT